MAFIDGCGYPFLLADLIISPSERLRVPTAQRKCRLSFQGLCMQARITLLFPLVLFVSGCSTGAWFKLPDETRLVVNERPASFDQGLVRSRPFSWGAAGGIPYRLVDGQSMTVKSGKLRSRFRVASIFWPPVGIAYWPMGYGQRCYDLTGVEPSTCTYEDYRQLRLAERMRR